MRVPVKQCMSPPDRTPRFEAGVGDVVLLASGDHSFVEATIRSVKSADIVVVSVLEGPHEVEREIAVSVIYGLVVDN